MPSAGNSAITSYIQDQALKKEKSVATAVPDAMKSIFFKDGGKWRFTTI